jgi:hypothetical protein
LVATAEDRLSLIEAEEKVRQEQTAKRRRRKERKNAKGLKAKSAPPT